MHRPADWPCPDQLIVAGARARVEDVLEDSPATVRDLKMFYDPRGNYAGPVFDDRTGSDPNEVGDADLLAVTAMDVQAGPRAIGKFRRTGNPRTDLLAALIITDDVPLWDASAAQMESAASLYRLVKEILSPTNMWVTTGKLCARKRPQLIPVRDRVIVAGLGLIARTFYEDWLVIGSVLETEEIRLELRRCAVEASAPDNMVGSVPETRLLDAVLWMRWSEARRTADSP